MNEVRQSSAKIFISSANKSQWVSSSSCTQLTVPINPFVLRNDDLTHFVIGVESLSIPLAIYMVTATNNTLIVNSVNYTIPVGNYTSATLLSALPAVLAFTFSTVTNVLTATPLGTYIWGGTAQRLLGYTSGSHASPYVFESTVNLATTSGIMIKLDDINTQNRDNVSGGSSILARIPITVAPFKVLQYFNSSPFYTTISNRHITSIKISLLNDDYTPLVLVGNPTWFVVLRLDFADNISSQRERQLIATPNVLVRK